MAGPLRKKKRSPEFVEGGCVWGFGEGLVLLICVLLRPECGRIYRRPVMIHDGTEELAATPLGWC
jgi:hypothetical protein